MPPLSQRVSACPGSPGQGHITSLAKLRPSVCPESASFGTVFLFTALLRKSQRLKFPSSVLIPAMTQSLAGAFFPPSSAESELEIQSREADSMEQFGCAAGEVTLPPPPGGEASLSRPPCLPSRRTDTPLPLLCFFASPACPPFITAWLCSLLSRGTAHSQRNACSVAGDLRRCRTLTMEGSAASRALARLAPRSLSPWAFSLTLTSWEIRAFSPAGASGQLSLTLIFQTRRLLTGPLWHPGLYFGQWPRVLK